MRHRRVERNEGHVSATALAGIVVGIVAGAVGIYAYASSIGYSEDKMSCYFCQPGHVGECNKMNSLTESDCYGNGQCIYCSWSVGPNGELVPSSWCSAFECPS